MINKRALSITLIILSTLATLEVNAQTDDAFVPSGKPLVLIYSDVNSSFNKNGNSRAFEITRAYLGYEYSFSKYISSRVNLDIGDPGVGKLQMTAYIKNAYVQFKKEKFSARFGMFGVDAYSLQEKQWGYRYLYKSYQDAYNFGPSADLGAGLEYSPARFISFDISVLNGEGYKKLQADSTFKTTIGLTLRPFNGFLLRTYYDRMKHNYAQSTYAFLAAYSLKGFRAGVEYNIQINNGMLNGHDFSGVSLYASQFIADKYSIFARYDNLRSETIGDDTKPWNNSKDGQAFIGGFDYSPVKGVKLAPTYIGWSPRDKSLKYTSTIGLYLELKF
jgi:hypothetical protein